MVHYILLLLPLWWDIWPSLLDILHFITLVMGQMTIITGHFTFYYPFDGTNDHHYGSLYPFITLVMGHMTIIMFKSIPMCEKVYIQVRYRYVKLRLRYIWDTSDAQQKYVICATHIDVWLFMLKVLLWLFRVTKHIGWTLDNFPYP